MRDDKTKKSKLSWSKKMVRKWFNIKSKTEKFQADVSLPQGNQKSTSCQNFVSLFCSAEL
jgi:hypothetical protein